MENNDNLQQGDDQTIWSYPLIIDLTFFHLLPFMLVNIYLISCPSFLSDSYPNDLIRTREFIDILKAITMLPDVGEMVKVLNQNVLGELLVVDH